MREDLRRTFSDAFRSGPSARRCAARAVREGLRGAAYDEDRDAGGRTAPRLRARARGAGRRRPRRALPRGRASAWMRIGVSFGPDPFVVDPVPRLLSRRGVGPARRGPRAARARAERAAARRLRRAADRARGRPVRARRSSRPRATSPTCAAGCPRSARPRPSSASTSCATRRASSSCSRTTCARRRASPTRSPRGAALDRRAAGGFAGAAPGRPGRLRAAGRRAARRGAAGLRATRSIVVLTDGPAQRRALRARAGRRPARRVARHARADSCATATGCVVRLPGGGHAPRRRRLPAHGRRPPPRRSGELTAIAGVLLEPWLSGGIGIVNALRQRRRRRQVRARLRRGLHPLLPRRGAARALGADARPIDGVPTIAELRELVVKPRHGHGGDGVVIGAHAETADLERLVGELEERPRALRHPADRRAVAPPDRHRRPPRAAPRRPARVRVLRRGRRADARRSDARRAEPGRARRQLLAARRRQGHLGRRLTRAAERPLTSARLGGLSHRASATRGRRCSGR